MMIKKKKKIVNKMRGKMKNLIKNIKRDKKRDPIVTMKKVDVIILILG